ncbi:Cof-type HAD-IIB family hydrolase [Streptomyces sp. DH24]|uniref:Cof-type HAD-IIB family hydrolase n=1 Tax=Streptomyces sp. DH24 TaxID=3040123 RepID=UPI0024410D60|nr:Cof-type HAD-IIB family hydrolase [Streptomyces sp. DH24]MDG9719770.1 Cof-type HAD-IIB family hydrolase [Streptomyces sp. DH24]
MPSRHPYDLPDAPPDIRLIVADMDGTLLDDAGRPPEQLPWLMKQLRERGVLFSPASGRQYATLAGLFHGFDDGMVYIVENGTYVVRDGQEIASDPLDTAVAARLVKTTRRLAADGIDVGAVVCGKHAAYTERTDDAFLAEVAKYYVAHRTVDDATVINDEINKVALFAFVPAARIVAPALAEFTATHQVVVSSEHWIDVMNPTANKGAALHRLQHDLHITPAQTLAFGDYLNDLEMLDTAEWSFATANAHPDVLRRARYTAPSNNDNGVVRTIERLLRLPAS